MKGRNGRPDSAAKLTRPSTIASLHRPIHSFFSPIESMETPRLSTSTSIIQQDLEDLNVCRRALFSDPDGTKDYPCICGTCELTSKFSFDISLVPTKPKAVHFRNHSTSDSTTIGNCNSLGTRDTIERGSSIFSRPPNYVRTSRRVSAGNESPVWFTEFNFSYPYILPANSSSHHSEPEVTPTCYQPLVQAFQRMCKTVRHFLPTRRNSS